MRNDPHHLGALTNLGNAYKDQGKPRMPLPPTERCCRSVPTTPRSTATCCWRCNTSPTRIPRPSFARRERYGRQHAEPGSRRRRASTPQQLCPRDACESATFHPTSASTPSLIFWSRSSRRTIIRHFEICCFADVPKPDATTRRLQGLRRPLAFARRALRRAGRRGHPPGGNRYPRRPGRSHRRESVADVRTQAGAHSSVVPWLPWDDRCAGHGLLYHGCSRRPTGHDGWAVPRAADPPARVRILLLSGPGAGLSAPICPPGGPATSRSAA